MKKTVCLILITFILISNLSITAYASDADCSCFHPTFLLRAGGGSSGGGGGGSSGGGGSHSHSHSSGSDREPTLLETVIGFILFPFVLFSSSIIFYIQLSKRSRKAKKLMKQMKKSDGAWKYKDVSADVKESFLAIQAAWTDMDMSQASRYMTEELRESFQTKLNWMKYKNQKNVLEKIRLVKALPVALHDDPDNSRDFIWFYIKGNMIDYTIDTSTQEIIEGHTFPSSFVEYWQFIRKEDRWVLSKILQDDEEDQIPFVE